MKIMSKISDWWFKKTEKHKACRWIDDNILYWLIDKPMDVYKTVRHWFYCNWNKEHARLVWAAWNSYGWDQNFILNLEELQIDKYLKWFSNHQLMVNEQYNEIMKSLRWAKHCIHVMVTEGDDYFEYSGDMKFHPVSKDAKSGEMVDTDDENAELHRLDLSEMEYHYKGPYVNIRNWKRFYGKGERWEDDEKQEKHLTSRPHQLYVQKCTHLYYMIRERYTELWWD